MDGEWMWQPMICIDVWDSTTGHSQRRSYLQTSERLKMFHHVSCIHMAVGRLHHPQVMIPPERSWQYLIWFWYMATSSKLLWNSLHIVDTDWFGFASALGATTPLPNRRAFYYRPLCMSWDHFGATRPMHCEAGIEVGKNLVFWK